jgi:ATP-dependent DNA helicase RecQ
VEWSESFFNPSQVHLQLHRDKLYAFQVANAPFDALIKMLLRLYGGQLEGFVRISEHQLAQALRISREEVVRMLRRLHELQVATYLPQKELPQVTFILPRQDAARLPLDRQRLAHRRGLAMERMEAMIRFATSGQTCRMQQVQLYFGEESWETCGICDVCVAKRKKENLAEAKGLRDEILRLAKENDYTLEQLEERIQPRDNELFIEVIRELVDENKLEYDEVWRLRRVRH